MADNIGIEVRGARQLRSTLKAAGEDLTEFTEVHGQVAGVVADAARSTAPTVTGRLAASVRPGATQRAAIVRAGRASAPYAGPINYGWPARNIAAQPFMNTAAKATEPRWTELFMRHIDKVLAKIRGA